MTILIFAAGFIFVLFGAMLIIAEKTIRRESQKVAGEVVGFATRQNRHKYSSTTSYHAVARFRHLDGQNHYTVSTTGSSSPLAEIGEEVPVYVRQSDLTFASIESSLSYYSAAILIALGAVFIAIFFATFPANPIVVVPSALILLVIANSVRKSLRKNPLTLHQWLKIKAKSKINIAYSEENKGEIPWATEEQVQAAIKKMQVSAKLIVPIFTIVGAVCLGYGLKSYKEKKFFIDTATHAEGTVVEMIKEGSSRKRTHTPIVEFTVPNTTTVQTFKNSFSTSKDAYVIGDKVDVIFDRAHPERAEIRSGFRNYSLSLILCAVGMVFLYVAWYTRKSVTRKASRRHGLRSPTQLL